MNRQRRSGQRGHGANAANPVRVARAAVRARVDVGAPQQEAVYEEAMEEVENLLRERPE